MMTTFLVCWGVSIVLSWLMLRQAYKISNSIVDNNDVVCMFIPGINLLVCGVCLHTAYDLYCNKPELDLAELDLAKLFHIKDNK